jgi:hypothetical protein
MLSGEDRTDLALGLALGLFMSGEFRASAALFDEVLHEPGRAAAPYQSSVLDWWAAALSRHAQTLPPDSREPIFAGMTARLREAWASEPGSSVAAYWLSVALHGLGHLDRAWNVAVASWVRAPLSTQTKDLRDELDRFVTTVLIPDRARHMATPSEPASQFESSLGVEWSELKEQWGR